MIIEQTFAVEASREATSAFFLDIDRVSACIPGVERVEKVGPQQYSAVLAVRLGPIRAAFQGAMSLDDSEAPARLTASGEGRDRATGSVAKVQFTADLTEEEPGRTTVTAVADVALRGRMAQFGTGVMRAAAGELVREFAACANASLAATTALAASPPAAGVTAAAEAQASAAATSPAAPPRPATTSPPVAPQPRPPASRGVLAILLRGLWRGLRTRLQRLVGRGVRAEERR